MGLMVAGDFATDFAGHVDFFGFV